MAVPLLGIIEETSDNETPGTGEKVYPLDTSQGHRVSYLLSEPPRSIAASFATRRRKCASWLGRASR